MSAFDCLGNFGSVVSYRALSGHVEVVRVHDLDSAVILSERNGGNERGDESQDDAEKTMIQHDVVGSGEFVVMIDKLFYRKKDLKEGERERGYKTTNVRVKTGSPRQNFLAYKHFSRVSIMRR